MNRIAQQIWDLAAPLAAEQGVELWDVTYTKEAGQWYLRVYIDKDGGIGINDLGKPYAYKLQISYGYNNGLMNDYKDGIRPGPAMSGWKKPSQTMAITDCTYVIFVYDSWCRISMANYDGQYPATSTYNHNPDVTAARHGGRDNVGFLDGHVATMNAKEIVPTNTSIQVSCN